MNISYNWLREYLPKDESISKIIENPVKVGEILTSVGLEVEGISKYEEISNNLDGFVIGEVIACEKHPDADKLKITQVDIGNVDKLTIVCGASNVAVGQKVVVALIGTTLYPKNSDPFTIKKAKIRGVESQGMLCAEDEIGMGNSHDGIIVLPADTKVGMPVNEYYQLYNDWMLEIGLTPNRMDAMSHLGVAKDVCAYLAHHNKQDFKVAAPYKNAFKSDNNTLPVQVEIKDLQLCPRYAGVSISGIKVAASPKWLQDKLKSIGLKPVNNIVDITNFILHETGQPLHAFDAAKIKGNKIIVGTLPEGTAFITLDEKERKLTAQDIMICNGDNEPMCIAGVYGGLESGVSEETVDIFLESAFFDPGSIRKSLLFHNLRTDAAVRFEKGIDISNTVQVLKRAALLIKEIAGGLISSEIVDVYPEPRKKTEITLSNHYLKKISGKNYHQDTVKNILRSLNFTIMKEGLDNIMVEVPFSNPDITIPADVIEEIMRIDGLDNVEIPSSIKMSPAIDAGLQAAHLKEKAIHWLNGIGFAEIFTNSITNSNYFDENTLAHTVKIINSLSEGLNVMRPSMLPTGLESVSYNINRKNNNLHLLEFGKTYSIHDGKYVENENLALYVTGNKNNLNWNTPSKKSDLYFVKGVCEAVFTLLGLKDVRFQNSKDAQLENCLEVVVNNDSIAKLGAVSKLWLEQFSIKQPVFFATIDWQKLIALVADKVISFVPIPKFPHVNRDLSIVVDKGISFQSVEDSVAALRLSKLIGIKLFDVFENEKLGVNKKSFAISFTFTDTEKTLTDKEIDGMMQKLIGTLTSNLNAEIRGNA